jgi:hypothetical protein
MAKYHGNGNPSSPIVQLQLHEITEDFARSRNDNAWWDFRELGNTRAARYRLAMVIAMAFFGQWSGNNVVSYFMPAMVQFCPIPSYLAHQLTQELGQECWHHGSQQAASYQRN